MDGKPQRNQGRGKRMAGVPSISVLALQALEQVVPRGQMASAQQVHEYMLTHLQKEMAGREILIDAVRVSLNQHVPRGLVECVAREKGPKLWIRTVRMWSITPPAASIRACAATQNIGWWVDADLMAYVVPCRVPSMAARRSACRLVVRPIPMGRRLVEEDMAEASA